ncbi:hypothetical protein PM082_005107 [Marasmius tenuissimus]|nr:hypothetical protein PM082_005107 [Marasmius tenuissimus]
MFLPVSSIHCHVCLIPYRDPSALGVPKKTRYEQPFDADPQAPFHVDSAIPSPPPGRFDTHSLCILSPSQHGVRIVKTSPTRLDTKNSLVPTLTQSRKYARPKTKPK